MLCYQPVALSDREWVEPLFLESGFLGSEYTFANLYNWSKTYTFALARYEDFVVVRNGNEEDCSYLYPAGRGDLRAVIEAMWEDAAAHGVKFRIIGITEDKQTALENLFPGRFRFTPVRDNADYLYRVEKLTALAGKKLHGKRNHINRFLENNPDWRYEPITRENIAAVAGMSAEWCRINNCSEDGSLKREACAVKSGLSHYFELGLTGGVLWAGGRVVGFTYGSAVSGRVFDVQVEKAFYDVQGAYPMINQQFVKNELQSFEYVNREDDLGDEGLRKAKLSYYPDLLLEKSIAEEI